MCVCVSFFFVLYHHLSILRNLADLNYPCGNYNRISSFLFLFFTFIFISSSYQSKLPLSTNRDRKSVLIIFYVYRKVSSTQNQHQIRLNFISMRSKVRGAKRVRGLRGDLKHFHRIFPLINPRKRNTATIFTLT